MPTNNQNFNVENYQHKFAKLSLVIVSLVINLGTFSLPDVYRVYFF